METDEQFEAIVAAADPNDQPEPDVIPTGGSFYTKRSAKLPRIGAENNNAMAAINVLRNALRDSDEPEDVAMRSA